MGLAGGASAQAAQTITVQPDRIHWDAIPEELPGTYRGLILVETTVSGGGCLCTPGTTTTVDLDLVTDEPITAAVVSPSSYAIDWWSEPHEMRDGHEKVVQVTLHVDRTTADLVTFELQSFGHTDSQVHHTQGLASEYAVPLPDDVHQGVTEQDASEQEDEGTDGPRGAEASTQSASEPSQLQQAAVPGIGAIAALIALGLVAWRRGRA